MQKQVEKKKPSFITTSIPSEMATKIDDEFVGKFGYRSRADFVIDAVRRRIEFLQKEAN